MNIILLNALLAGLVGTALVGGLFFAFSVCVMKSLSQLPQAEGLRVMQTMNRVILNPVFLIVFMGTAVLSLVSAVSVWMGWGGDFPDVFILAAGVYLVGVFVVTARGNVPLNDKLAELNGIEAIEFWTVYLSRWTKLNHVRTVSAAVSVFLYGVGFTQYVFNV